MKISLIELEISANTDYLETSPIELRISNSIEFIQLRHLVTMTSHKTSHNGTLAITVVLRGPDGDHYGQVSLCSVQGQTLKVTKDGCLHSFIRSPNKSPHQPAHHCE